ncbi:chain length determinant protein EpsF [Roseateles sp. BYS180W]|uniref:Chain length determinant protein EpsF n=1 Tax=Roseateles rivi TaxID=3299028 RepID=A0ABW7FSP8_9BURK
MNLQQFINILKARKLAFLLVLLGIVIPAVLVSFLLPKRYTAVASVVLDVKPDPITGLSMQSMMTSSMIATQVDIITSDRVARRVIKGLKLEENPALREQWRSETDGEGEYETWLVELFQKNLDVRPSRESSVINISYQGAEPRFAAALSNAFVQAYLDTVLELRVDPARQYSTFFDARAKDARDALERAQTKLSAFQREKGVVMTDERMDVETQRLNELTTQLVAIQAMSADSGSRNVQAQGGAAEKMSEVNSHPVVAGLRSDLTRLEAKYKEMSSRLGESHPQIQELLANVNELKARLSTEVKRLSDGVSVTNTITKQREAQVRAELDEQKAKVLKLKQVRDEGMLIFRDVEAAQRAYDQIQQRLTQTSLESQVTSSNISLLTPATPPLIHSFPKITLNIALSVIIGALFGAAAVIGLELKDRKIRDTADLTALLSMPVLGVLPCGQEVLASPKRTGLIGMAANSEARPA